MQARCLRFTSFYDMYPENHSSYYPLYPYRYPYPPPARCLRLTSFYDLYLENHSSPTQHCWPSKKNTQAFQIQSVSSFLHQDDFANYIHQHWALIGQWNGQWNGQWSSLSGTEEGVIVVTFKRICDTPTTGHLGTWLLISILKYINTTSALYYKDKAPYFIESCWNSLYYGRRLHGTSDYI